jgi:hypothetical protein
VDWNAIVMRGRTETNFQLLPGDRVYVEAQSVVAVNNIMTKLFAPINNLAGTVLLGRSVVSVFAQPLNQTGFGNTGP